VVPSRINATAASASNPELRDATAQSYAAFANVTVPLLASVRLTGGLRYTHDEKGARFVYTDGSATPDARSSRAWDSLTYKAQIEADVGAHSLLYGQVSSGFKAGGYAQQFPAATYNPEKLTAFEIGSKNRFLDNRLQVNASAFYYDYSNYQAQYPDLVDGAFALVTSNAATARLYGGEVETRFALTANDTLSLNGALIHTRFGAFTYTSLLAGTVTHTGEALPNAPTLTADLAYEHVFHLAGGATLTGHVNTHLTRGYWTTVERSTDSYQPGFTRTDAFLNYVSANGRWELRAFVRNLENTAVRTLGAANPVDAVLLLAPPRTYGAAATVRF
ncbi:MAG TPA: TonB-dependent receptor, partial [Novosphingobium sp.]|nr:TonB-dependent receptor [Novosphingobium sp.]